MSPIKNDSSTFAHSTKIGSSSHKPKVFPWKNAAKRIQSSSAIKNSPHVAGATKEGPAIPPMSAPTIGW